MAGTPVILYVLASFDLLKSELLNSNLTPMATPSHALLEFLLGKDFLFQLDAVTAPGRSREEKNDGKPRFLRLLLGALQALSPAEFHLGGLGRFGGGFLVRRDVLSQGNPGNAESHRGA